MDALDPRLVGDAGGNFEEQKQNNPQHDQQSTPQHAQHHQPILPHDPRSASLSSQNQPHSTPLFRDTYDENSHQQQSYALPPMTPGANDVFANRTQSIHNDSVQKLTPAAGPTPDNDTKRPRACEACRGLKVKCEFEPTHPDGPCKRCTKAHRQCLITAPSRKRQKKTDSRVAELEKKIDALTQTLQATRSASQGEDHDSNANVPIGRDRRMSQVPAHPYEQITSIAYGPQYTGRAEAGHEPLAPSSFGQAMKINAENTNQGAWPAQDFQQYSRMPELSRPEIGFPQAPMGGQNMAPVGKAPMVIAGQKRKHSKDEAGAAAPGAAVPGAQRPGSSAPTMTDGPAGRPNSKHSMTNEYADVIDRGLIKSSLASELFDRYTHLMAPTMPAVIFPSGTTAADIRKTKPILFLAILAVGAMTDHTNLAKLFTKEVMQVYADRIICRGEKSLELIQAILVSTLWYWPPEHFEEVKFYQLIHIAAVMAVDIGIHKQNKVPKPSSSAGPTPSKSMTGMWNWRKQAFPDASSIESRRTWLSCYFICCNASTGLRRPNMVHWSPYIVESIEMLETSPLAVPSDKLIAQWARSQHIMERVMPHFGLDDDQSNVTLSDPDIQAALAGYEHDLDEWRNQVPIEGRGGKLNIKIKDENRPLTSAIALLKMSGHIVSLFMHEIALNVDTPSSPKQNKTNAEQQIQAPLPEAQITALAKCMESIDEIFEIFLSLDVDTIRVLPVMHFVRVAYAIAILMKVYFAATSPGNPFGSVVDKDNMKVELYLEQLLHKFKDIVGEEKSRPGSKFLMVLIMLRNCFYRGQKKSNGNSALPSAQQTRPGSAQDLEGVPSSQQQSPQQPQQPQQPGQMNSGYGQGSTPLDLLSQVATGSSQATPQGQVKTENCQSYPPAQGHVPWAPWDTPNTSHISSLQQQQQNGLSYNIDPSLSAQPQQMGGFDANSGLGDGFDSIGMLGEGDLSQYFGDDAYQAFFKAMMEGAGTGGMGFDEYPMSIM